MYLQLRNLDNFLFWYCLNEAHAVSIKTVKHVHCYTSGQIQLQINEQNLTKNLIWNSENFENIPLYSKNN